MYLQNITYLDIKLENDKKNIKILHTLNPLEI